MMYNYRKFLTPIGAVVSILGFLIIIGLAGVVRRMELLTPGLSYTLSIASICAWIVFCLVVFRRK